MRYFRSHIGRFFSFLIAIQILNMSIDAPNAQMPPNAQGSDDFNYIDTYVEFVAEVILKHENAIPELPNRDQKEAQMQKQFELVFQKIESFHIPFIGEERQNSFSHSSDGYAYQFVKEINPPPPKV
jgi:hypothetical protein